MTEEMKQVGDPEQIHLEVVRLEDEIMPVLTKIRNAIKLANKQASDEDCDAIDRIEGLEYFKNESGYLMQWIDKYMNLCEELRCRNLPLFTKDSKLVHYSAAKDLINVDLEEIKKLEDDIVSLNKLIDSYKKVQEVDKEMIDKLREYSKEEVELRSEYEFKYNQLCKMSFKEWFRIRFLGKLKKS